MAVTLDHTIVAARDARSSARFLARILGLDAPRRLFHFEVVELGNGVSLDYADADGDVTPQHYAFLITEEEFDAVHGRILAEGVDHWADPSRRHPGRINHGDGGRGVYFADPDGHLLEVLTRRYGSGA